MRIGFKAILLPILAAAMLSLVGCGGGGSDSSGPAGGAGRIVGTAHETSLADSSRAAGDLISLNVQGTSLKTVAAANGQFALENVPAGLHTLVARTARRALALVVRVQAGQDTSVGEIVLQEAGQISGLVTAAGTREPIAGAMITVTQIVPENPDDQMPCPVYLEYTNPQGSYTVSGLPVGDYLVHISADGYSTESLKISVAAGVTTPGDAQLSPAAPVEKGSLTGKVFLKTDDGDIQPLEGALVRLALSDYPYLLRPMPALATDEKGDSVPMYPGARPDIAPEIYTFSDKDGKYTLEGVPVGKYVAVAVRPGLEPAQQEVTIAANATATADFTLTLRKPDAGIVEGTVIGEADGKPVAGAMVSAIIYGPPPMMDGKRGASGSGQGSSPGGMMIAPGEYELFAVTDEAGRYRLLLPPAVTAIGVYAEGFEPQELPVTVTTGGSTTVDVRLKALSNEEVPLSGAVYTANEQGVKSPVQDATVYAGYYSTDPDIALPAVVFKAKSDAEGKYRLPLRPGVYFAYAVKDDLRSDIVYLKVYQATSQDFLLQPGELPPPIPMGKPRK
ncbi:MAG: carboxypeptidase regulatory-like domain-containing protein [Armatimonadetes bacterium]|nr:carboxypeptidase regulatory-like domain-containing protein [Armatimonadota bacterium]